MSQVIPQEFLQNRQTALRQQLQSRQLDSLIIFSAENLRYLCGYTGEAACVLFTLDTCYLITDYRFSQQARQECLQTRVIERDRDTERLGECLASLAQESGLSALSFESEKISVAQWQQIYLDLAPRQILPLNACVEQLRKRKDTWEVAQIRQAAAIADQALANCLLLLQPGISEKAFATELEYELAKLGSTGLAFPTIAVFGENTAMPHGMPSDKILREGEFITIDFGAVVNGYRSDMTRSYICGEASEEQFNMMQTVLNAQQAALDRLAPGLQAKLANKAAHDILQASPFARHAGPGLGHGLGLFLHEQPHLGPHCTENLEPNFVITIEPGLYVPNLGGVRFEDDVLITDKGIEILTKAPKAWQLKLDMDCRAQNKLG